MNRNTLINILIIDFYRSLTVKPFTLESPCGFVTFPINNLCPWKPLEMVMSWKPGYAESVPFALFCLQSIFCIARLISILNYLIPGVNFSNQRFTVGFFLFTFPGVSLWLLKCLLVIDIRLGWVK